MPPVPLRHKTLVLANICKQGMGKHRSKRKEILYPEPWFQPVNAFSLIYYYMKGTWNYKRHIKLLSAFACAKTSLQMSNDKFEAEEAFWTLLSWDVHGTSKTISPTRLVNLTFSSIRKYGGCWLWVSACTLEYRSYNKFSYYERKRFWRLHPRLPWVLNTRSTK